MARYHEESEQEVQFFDLSEDEEEIAVGSAMPGKKQEDNDDEDQEEFTLSASYHTLSSH
jgi:hypothetical protein